MQQVESPFYTPLVVDAEQQREREHEAPEQSRKALATRMEKVYMGIGQSHMRRRRACGPGADGNSCV
jgi:hypothetical protein